MMLLHRFGVPSAGRSASRFATSLLLALAVSPAARAVTAVSIDHHADPVTLSVGETVTIRLDVAKAGGTVQFRLARDESGTGKYDPAYPISTSFPSAITDGGGGDTDPAPGKIAWEFFVEPRMAAGRYILHLQDITDNTQFSAPVWTVVPKAEAQGVSGRVVLGSGSSAPGSPPPDAIIWAYSDLGTAITSADVGPDGRYTLPVPPGTYILFAEWFGNLRSQRQVVTVAAGQAVGPVNHVLLVGQEVSGSLRDDAGKPLANAPVEATPSAGPAFTTRTFADGTYLLVLPEGKYRVSGRGLEKLVTVADQPVDGVDFPSPATGPPPAVGTILTVAGSGRPGVFLGGDGGPAVFARMPNVAGLAIDRAGNLYAVDSLWNRVRRVDGMTGLITTAAGSTTIDAIRSLIVSSTGGFSGDGGPATAARLDAPGWIAVNGAGNLFISDRNNQRIRRVEATTGIITTVAGSGPVGNLKGSFSGDGGPATAATLSNPQGIAFDGAGNLYIADQLNGRVRKVSPDGIITTVAGGGTNPLAEGADALTVTLKLPRNVAVDGTGNLFIWDGGLNRVLKMLPDGKLRIYAGNGTAGFSGDGGPATAAQLDAPIAGMAVDSAGNLFLADQNNNRVRKVSVDGIITTVAGSGPTGNGKGGVSGDGGPATAAQLSLPRDVAIDAAGNLYISDGLNKRVRKVIGIAAPGALAPGG